MNLLEGGGGGLGLWVRGSNRYQGTWNDLEPTNSLKRSKYSIDIYF